MWFSHLKRVAASVLSWGFGSSSEDADEDVQVDERTILNNIKQLNLETKDTVEVARSKNQLLGRSEPVQYEVETFKCIHKTGKVTHLCKEYGLIDNVIYFEPHQVADNVKPTLHDEVVYSVYGVRGNKAERLYKVHYVKSNIPGDEESNSEWNEALGFEKTEEITTITRVITGRVTRRRKREVFIESANIWCNLDKINAEYIPVEGDWVELQAVVTVDEKSENLVGEVLEVKWLKPLLKKTGCGRVTFWSELTGEGAIENSIYFTRVACKEGSHPSLGDEVMYSAVESDQERYRWRALRVVSKCYLEQEDLSLLEEEDAENLDLRKLNLKNLLKNKYGICVKPAVVLVEVELNEVKTVTVEVANKGRTEQLIMRSNFLNKDSQMRLVRPKESVVTILPKERILYEFECEGKFLGLVVDVFFFHFKNFVIGKKFEVRVTGNKDMNKLLECKFGTVFKVFEEKQYVKNPELMNDLIVYGPKPWKPRKFIPKESRCVFNIPKNLWEMSEEGTRRIKDQKLVLEEMPCLDGDLTFANYADRFHTLLYLEEIYVRVSFRKYDSKEVFLQRCEEYFVIEVPGLVEKRPSLVLGDKVYLTQAWSEGDKIKHIGYIHCIKEKEVFVKFHQSFHNNYDGSECDIWFEPNPSGFWKAHEAINRAVRVLGENWLFPSAVNEKPPQCVFSFPHKEDECAPETPPTDALPNDANLPSMNQPSDGEGQPLTWVNKRLNKRQKLAVASVLRGQGRPLPYIIFGPPGTGKTITLVETVIQIYRMIPDSRILITAPSNSAADLICERLIDDGKFMPGELVRLVAIYRIYEGVVPPKLIPYSTCYVGPESLKKVFTETWLRGHKTDSWNEFSGRQRITVATCASISVLHYLGLPPGHFTHILVDEAGQTTEPETLLSATFQNMPNSQLVLTGDPQQLGPLVNCKVAMSCGLGNSLMQRLISRFPYVMDCDGFPDTSGYDPRFITKLNVNYRTIPEILSLPSQMFYNADLIATISQTCSKEAAIVRKFNFKGVGRTTPCAIIFYGIIGQNLQEDSPSWFNPHEIWQVVFFVKKLYSLGLNSDDIGIVTPYSKQVQKLRHLLPNLNLSVPKIGSVEEFQGQERLVIIVSTVRSSPKLIKSDISHYLGFVASPQRLNVALTRARALLIIVGNPILLLNDPYWANVIRYCRENRSYVGSHLKVFGELHGPKKDHQVEEDP